MSNDAPYAVMTRGPRRQLAALQQRLARYEALLDRRAEFMAPHRRGVDPDVMDGCLHCAAVRTPDERLDKILELASAAVRKLESEVAFEERQAWQGLEAVAAIGG